MAFEIWKTVIERYVKGNRIRKWAFAYIDDDGKQFLKCTRISDVDRKTGKVLESKRVSGLVTIPSHVREEAQKRFTEWKNGKNNKGLSNEGI